MSTEIKELNTIIAKDKKAICDLKNDIAIEKAKANSIIKETFADLLPVLDTIDKAKTVIQERGWADSDEAGKILKKLLGVEQIMKNKLENHGIKEMSIAEGDLSDDNLCSCSDTEPDPSKANGTIVSIERKGYTYNGEVLRRADVVIVKN